MYIVSIQEKHLNRKRLKKKKKKRVIKASDMKANEGGCPVV